MDVLKYKIPHDMTKRSKQGYIRSHKASQGRPQKTGKTKWMKTAAQSFKIMDKIAQNCTRQHKAAQGSTSQLKTAQACTRLYKAVQGCTRLQNAA